VGLSSAGILISSSPK